MDRNDCEVIQIYHSFCLPNYTWIYLLTKILQFLVQNKFQRAWYVIPEQEIDSQTCIFDNKSTTGIQLVIKFKNSNTKHACAYTRGTFSFFGTTQEASTKKNAELKVGFARRSPGRMTDKNDKTRQTRIIFVIAAARPRSYRVYRFRAAFVVTFLLFLTGHRSQHA